MKTVLMVLMGFFTLINTGRGQSPSFGSGLTARLKTSPTTTASYDLLDAQIQNGDLTAYDAMHHMTKLSWLLRKSQAATVSH